MPVTPLGTVLTKDVGVSSAMPVWAVGDVNGDGRPDLVLAAAGPFAYQSQPIQNPSTPVQVLLNLPTGFIDGTAAVFGGAVPTALVPSSVKVADFGGNGRPSFYISETGLDAFPYSGGQQHLLLSTGSGLADASSGLPNPPEGTAYAHSSAVADINRDGRPDIFVGSAVSQVQPYFLINMGGGAFAETRANLPLLYFSVEVLSRSGGTTVSDSHRYTASALADINKDGAADLILGAMDGTRSNIVLLNDGQGDFSKSPPITLPTALYGSGLTTQNGATFSTTGTIALRIAPIDLNRDGFSDLAIAETRRDPATGSYVGGSLQILMNQNGSSFVDVTASSLSGLGPTLGIPATNGTFIYDLLADDLYGSGNPSLLVYVASGAASYSTIILQSDGQGHLSQGAPSGLNYQSLLIPLHQGASELDWASVAYSIYGNTGTIAGMGPYGLFNENVSLGMDSTPVVPTPVIPVVVTTSFSGPAARYTLTATAGSSTVSVRDKVGGDGTKSLSGGERLQFTDLAIDSTMVTKAAGLTAAQVAGLVELYIASFNRAPDALGLDYWGSQLKDGMSLQAIAKSFFTQPETAAAYPAGQSTQDFVTKVYNNVLNRGPDADGLAYWSGQLQANQVSRDSFLLAILNGAHANAGAGADQQTLTNKELVGAHFAVAQGLSNATWAKAVMSQVNSTAASVSAANAQTDSFAALADAAGTSELVVKIVGIAA